MNGLPISWLAESSLCGSVAIVLLFLMRPLVRRWLGARALHLLWVVVLVRLLIPWTPRTPFAMLPARTRSEAAPVPMTVRSFVIAAGQIPSVPMRISEAVPERHLPPFAASIAGSAALIWILGAAGIFGLSLTAALRTARLVRRARGIAPDSPAMRVLASLPLSVHRLRVLETRDLKTPALCGMLRPTILLPPGWADTLAPDELRCVLLHEIGHHRRGDVLWRWGFLAARAIHWFNPLVWIAERKMRTDQEMACDEWVLAHDGGIDPQRYGEVLLRACKNLTSLRITSPGHATMAESASGLAQRIRHIARMKSHGWPAFAVTAALAAVICVIGPSPGDAQNPPRVVDDSTGAPAVASPPASVPSQIAPPSTAPGAKAGIKSGNITFPSAPTPSAAAKEKAVSIEIEAKFVERSGNASKELLRSLPGGAPGSDPVSILEDSQFQLVIRALNQTKGIDLLSAPRVTCKSGQMAMMEIVREFRYPTEYNAENDGSGRVTPSAFESRNVGVTLEVLATAGAGGRIDMALTPSVVEFAGFVNYGAGRPARQTLKGDALTELMKNPSTKHIINQPIFNTRKISTSASIHSGQTVIVGGVGGLNGADAPASLADWQQDFYRRVHANGTDSARTKSGGTTARTKKTGEDKSEKYLFILVSARIVDPERMLPAGKSPDPTQQPQPSAAPSPSSTESEITPAVPVPNKPGFVTSPYAPKSGYVDVRGFPPGTKLQCPYTGKYFLTP